MLVRLFDVLECGRDLCEVNVNSTEILRDLFKYDAELTG
jgi:hypothetical protein